MTKELEKIIEKKAEQIIDTEMTELLEEMIKAAFSSGAQTALTLEVVSKMPEVKALIDTLAYYSNGEHFKHFHVEVCEHLNEPDTVSGEPENYYEGHGDYGFEDGTLATNAVEPWLQYMDKEQS